jgi:glycerophosphoryl diester phosphodiesterase
MARLIFQLSVFLVFAINVSGFEIHGHRGARSFFPENSLAGFYHAIEAGADYIEVDVHLSKDGVLVIHHDHKINRSLCRVPRKLKNKYDLNYSIRDWTFADLNQVDCGLSDSDFPKQKPVKNSFIPSLVDLYKMIAEMNTPASRDVKINVEFKTKWFENDDYITAMIERYNYVTDAFQYFPRTMIQSFNKDLVRYAKYRFPEVRVHYLSTSASDRIADKINNWGLDGASIYHARVDRSLVSHYHSMNKKIIPWTANDPMEWDSLIRAGVDGIITDNPYGLAQFIGRYYPEIKVQFAGNF